MELRDNTPYLFLDPGHGGAWPDGDPGAVGRQGLREADVVLAVAYEVKRLLERYYRVYMSRYVDEDVALRRRALRANSEEADYFISIHTNGANAEAFGVETHHWPGSEKGRALAQAVQDAMVEHLGERDRGLHESRFTVLQYTRMPAVLVELPFITNEDQEQRYKDNKYIILCAEAIADGVMRHLSGEADAFRKE